MSINASDYNETHPQLITIRPERVYADLDLAFERHPIYNDVRPVKDIDAVKNSVKNLLLTNRGERPFQPNLGSGLFDLLFENSNPYTIQAVRSKIIDMLTSYEPRINQVKVSIQDLPEDNAIHVKVGFNITSIVDNEEVEFYLERLR